MPTFTEMEETGANPETNQPVTEPAAPQADAAPAQETVGDPFEQLLAASEQADPFATPASSTQDETVAQPTEAANSAEPAEAKQDEGQFQYWQSQYDKAQRELTELKEQHSSLKDIEPLAKYIQDNPAVLDSVESSLSSGKTPGQPAGNQAASLKKPERPTKPANYDAILSLIHI